MEWTPNSEALQNLAGILSISNRSSSAAVSSSYDVGFGWKWDHGLATGAGETQPRVSALHCVYFRTRGQGESPDQCAHHRGIHAEIMPEVPLQRCHGGGESVYPQLHSDHTDRPEPADPERCGCAHCAAHHRFEFGVVAGVDARAHGDVEEQQPGLHHHVPQLLEQDDGRQRLRAGHARGELPPEHAHSDVPPVLPVSQRGDRLPQRELHALHHRRDAERPSGEHGQLPSRRCALCFTRRLFPG